MRRHVTLLALAMITAAGFLWLPEFASASMKILPGRRSSYRRYRYKRRAGRIPFAIKLTSLRVRGAIERKKLRRSIKTKLKKIGRCIQLRRRTAWSRKRRGNRRNLRRRTVILPPIAKQTLAVKLIVNGHGRALKTSVLSKRPPSDLVRDCFLWFLKGKRYFPPESEKKTQIRLQFVISPKRAARFSRFGNRRAKRRK